MYVISARLYEMLLLLSDYNERTTSDGKLIACIMEIRKCHRQTPQSNRYETGLYSVCVCVVCSVSLSDVCQDVT